MKTLSNYPAKIFIGMHNDKKIYLSAPSWDCGWYWGFGYIGNNNCHYHIDGLTRHKTYDIENKCFKYEFTDLYDGFKKHFGKSLIVRDSQLWKLVELFKTFYILKESADTLGGGGAHYTTNPCADIIKNADEVTRINNVVLPAIFEEIYKILIPAQNNEETNKKLFNLYLQGDTDKVIDFMFENSINTDDLKDIEEFSKYDFNYIHSRYWDRVHSKKQTV